MPLLCSHTRTGFSNPPTTIIAPLSNVNPIGRHLGAVDGDTNTRTGRSRSRAPKNARRYTGKHAVVQRQFSSGGTGGWFGGAMFGECEPCGENSGGRRDGSPFPVSRTA